MLPSTFHIPVAVILVLGGAVACFAGYRLFRIVLSIYGFLLGAMMATTLAGPGETGQLVLYAVVGGVIGALVLNLAYFLGVVLVGAALGALAASVLWAQMGGEPHVLVVVLFAVAGAVGAMLLQRFVIVAATAFGGAWTLLVGALTLAGEEPGADDVWVFYPMDPAPGQGWVRIAWIALGLTGLVAQLAQGRGRQGRERGKK